MRRQNDLSNEAFDLLGGQVFRYPVVAGAPMRACRRTVGDRQRWHPPHHSLDAIGQMISRLKLRPHSQQRLPEIHIPDFAHQQVAA